MATSRHRRSSVVEAHEIYLKYHRHHEEMLVQMSSDSTGGEEGGDPYVADRNNNEKMPQDLGDRDHKVILHEE